MMEYDNSNLLEILDYIDPSLDYQEWVNVGMALKRCWIHSLRLG